MSNERLRAAMHQAGIEVQGLADHVEVDVKSARRWLSGRTPRPTHRLSIAALLGVTEAEIWPELELRVAGRDEKAEILAAYAHANDLSTPSWQTLLEHAQERIDLLDPTLHDVVSAAGTVELLGEKAESGCPVRLLFSDPGSAHLTLAEAANGDDLGLLDIPESARDAERTFEIAAELATRQGVAARTFIAANANTILRFDDEMLVVLYIRGAAADQAPLLHLKRHSDHGLFQRFADHFTALWDDARAVPSSGSSLP